MKIKLKNIFRKIFNTNLSTTERGFHILHFKDRYGVDCTLQESSLATEACIWLGANKLEVKEFVAHRQPEVWKNIEFEDTMEHHFVGNNRMHLNQEQVKLLLPYLKHFARTGEL